MFCKLVDIRTGTTIQTGPGLDQIRVVPQELIVLENRKNIKWIYDEESVVPGIAL